MKRAISEISRALSEIWSVSSPSFQENGNAILRTAKNKCIHLGLFVLSSPTSVIFS